MENRDAEMVKTVTRVLTTSYVIMTCVTGQCQTIEPGLYQLETQTVMPHLDEMRHKTQHGASCVGSDGQIKRLFPIMKQPGLKDCYFRQGAKAEATAFFQLQCDALNGAEGRATIKIEKQLIKASLDAKLGGKNMTFTQLTRAKRMGDCIP